MAWYAFVYEDPDWVERFKGLARRYAHQLDAEQLYQDALQGLIVRLIEKSDELPHAADSPDTRRLLTRLFTNALVDEYRRQRGRHEPPSWLRPFGRLGRKLYALRCNDQLSNEETARVAVASSPERVDAFESGAAYAEAVARIIADPRWSAVCRPRLQAEHDTQQLATVPDPGQDPSRVEGDELASLLGLLMGGRAAAAAPLAERLRLGPPPALDDEERFLLRAHYQEGMGISAIARLRGERRHVVDYRHKQLLQRIERWLRAAGLAAGDVL